MNAVLEGLFLGTLRVLIRAYPPPFRARFGGEMMQVYVACVLQVSRKAGTLGLVWLWLSMVWDGAFSALAQWGHHWFKQITKGRLAMTELDTVDSQNGATPLSVGQTFLAVLPFLLFGAANLAAELNLVVYNESTTLGFWMVTNPIPLFYWLILIGLAVGILLGLPRWAYTYLGWALLSTLWFTNVYYNDRSMRFMLIPLALVIAIPLFIRWLRCTQIRTLKLVLPDPWRGLTLLPLALYIIFAALFMIYDENHHPALLWFIAGAGLAASLGVWGFFRAASSLRRALSLVGGLALVIALEFWNSLTWDAGAYYGLTNYSPLREHVTVLILFVAIAVLMLGVGGLAEIKRREGT